MGKSLILKDKGAQPVGYIQQMQNSVRCRLTACTEGAACEIWLFGTGGICRKEALPPDGEELHLAVGGDVVGAALVSNGRYVAGTGKDALLMYAKSEAKKEEEHREMKVNEAELTAKKEERSEIRRFPARRWPPPAGCPQAVYREGAWSVGDDVIGSEMTF